MVLTSDSETTRAEAPGNRPPNTIIALRGDFGEATLHHNSSKIEFMANKNGIDGQIGNEVVDSGFHAVWNCDACQEGSKGPNVEATEEEANASALQLFHRHVHKVHPTLNSLDGVGNYGCREGEVAGVWRCHVEGCAYGVLNEMQAEVSRERATDIAKQHLQTHYSMTHNDGKGCP